MILDVLPPLPIEEENNWNNFIATINDWWEIENNIEQCWIMSCENEFILKTTATSFLIWIVSITILTAIIYLLTRKKSKYWTFKKAMAKIWKYYVIMWIVFIILTIITIKTLFLIVK